VCGCCVGVAVSVVRTPAVYACVLVATTQQSLFGSIGFRSSFSFSCSPWSARSDVRCGMHACMVGSDPFSSCCSCRVLVHCVPVVEPMQCRVVVWVCSECAVAVLVLLSHLHVHPQYTHVSLVATPIRSIGFRSSFSFLLLPMVGAALTTCAVCTLGSSVRPVYCVCLACLGRHSERVGSCFVGSFSFVKSCTFGRVSRHEPAPLASCA
jgi:hypothetical protein